MCRYIIYIYIYNSNLLTPSHFDLCILWVFWCRCYVVRWKVWRSMCVTNCKMPESRRRFLEIFGRVLRKQERDKGDGTWDKQSWLKRNGLKSPVVVFFLLFFVVVFFNCNGDVKSAKVFHVCFRWMGSVNQQPHLWQDWPKTDSDLYSILQHHSATYQRSSLPRKIGEMFLTCVYLSGHTIRLRFKKVQIIRLSDWSKLRLQQVFSEIEDAISKWTWDRHVCFFLAINTQKHSFRTIHHLNKCVSADHSAVKKKTAFTANLAQQHVIDVCSLYFAILFCTRWDAWNPTTHKIISTPTRTEFQLVFLVHRTISQSHWSSSNHSQGLTFHASPARWIYHSTQGHIAVAVPKKNVQEAPRRIKRTKRVLRQGWLVEVIAVTKWMGLAVTSDVPNTTNDKLTVFETKIQWLLPVHRGWFRCSYDCYDDTSGEGAT